MKRYIIKYCVRNTYYSSYIKGVFKSNEEALEQWASAMYGNGLKGIITDAEITNVLED